MAGFGDNSSCFQRHAIVPGGLVVESGCWTQTSDATIYIPTQMATCVACVINTDSTEGIGFSTVPCVSSGYIKGTCADGSGKIINYVAFGF